MNAPSIDYSPLFSAFNSYAKAKSRRNNSGIAFAQAGVGIAQVGWDYYVKNDQIDARDICTGVQNEFQQAELDYATGEISEEDFNAKGKELDQRLQEYKPRTEYGKTIIQDYRTNGLYPNRTSVAKQAAPILLARITATAEKMIQERAKESVANEDGYLESLQALDALYQERASALGKSEEEFAKTTNEKEASGRRLAAAQEEHTQATTDRELAAPGSEDESYAAAKRLESAQAERTAAEEADIALGASLGEKAKSAEAARAETRAAEEAYIAHKKTGVDAYAEEVRKIVVESGALKPWQTDKIDTYVDRAVLFRNNLLANKRIAEGLQSHNYIGAIEYIERHPDFYASPDDQKAARAEVEKQRKQFEMQKYTVYMSQAQQPEVWWNTDALNGIIRDIHRDALFKLQGEEMPDTVIDELTRRVEEVGSGRNDEQEKAENMLWTIAAAMRGKNGEAPALGYKDGMATANQLFSQGDIRGKTWIDFINFVGKDAIGENDPVGQRALDTFKTALDDWLGPENKRDEKSPEFQEKMGRYDFMMNEFSLWLMQNRGATTDKIGKKKDELLSATYGKDAIKTLSIIKAPVTRQGVELFGQQVGGKTISQQRAKIYAQFESGTGDPYVNYNPMTGNLEMLPEIKNAYDEMQRSMNNEFEKSEFNGKKYKIGKDAVPVTLETGTIIYVVKDAGGKSKIIYPHANAKRPEGIEFSGSSNTVFTAKAAEVAKKIDAGPLSMAEAARLHKELSSAKSASGGLNADEQKLYSGLEKMLIKIGAAEAQKELNPARKGPILKIPGVNQ
jgi:hypothetical protein